MCFGGSFIRIANKLECYQQQLLFEILLCPAQWNLGDFSLLCKHMWSALTFRGAAPANGREAISWRLIWWFNLVKMGRISFHALVSPWELVPVSSLWGEYHAHIFFLNILLGGCLDSFPFGCRKRIFLPKFSWAKKRQTLQGHSVFVSRQVDLWFLFLVLWRATHFIFASFLNLWYLYNFFLTIILEGVANSGAQKRA